MRCSKCAKVINNMNHYFVPKKNDENGLRYCIKCAREENIITLV